MEDDIVLKNLEKNINSIRIVLNKCINEMEYINDIDEERFGKDFTEKFMHETYIAYLIIVDFNGIIEEIISFYMQPFNEFKKKLLILNNQINNHFEKCNLDKNFANPFIETRKYLTDKNFSLGDTFYFYNIFDCLTINYTIIEEINALLLNIKYKLNNSDKENLKIHYNNVKNIVKKYENK